MHVDPSATIRTIGSNRMSKAASKSSINTIAPSTYLCTPGLFWKICWLVWCFILSYSLHPPWVILSDHRNCVEGSVVDHWAWKQVVATDDEQPSIVEHLVMILEKCQVRDIRDTLTCDVACNSLELLFDMMIRKLEGLLFYAVTLNINAWGRTHKLGYFTQRRIHGGVAHHPWQNSCSCLYIDVKKNCHCLLHITIG